MQNVLQTPKKNNSGVTIFGAPWTVLKKVVVVCFSSYFCCWFVFLCCFLLVDVTVDISRFCFSFPVFLISLVIIKMDLSFLFLSFNIPSLSRFYSLI